MSPIASLILFIVFVVIIPLIIKMVKHAGKDVDTEKLPQTKYDDGNETAEQVVKRLKSEQIKWAKNCFESKHSYVIVDTETTGIDDSAEVIELAMIDLDGNVLYNSRIKPLHKKRMPAKAKEVHGISMSDLKSCPSWPDEWSKIEAILKGRKILSYNAEFDNRVIRQTAEINGGEEIGATYECIMQHYAIYFGEWNAYRKNFKWQKLQGGDHTALGDCRAALDVLKKMANDGQP